MRSAGGEYSKCDQRDDSPRQNKGGELLVENVNEQLRSFPLQLCKAQKEVMGGAEPGDTATNGGESGGGGSGCGVGEGGEGAEGGDGGKPGSGGS
eukprot:scaffold95753_cov70-Phaeocystis_antarctica.AAC.3